jgi:hypothetical protein
MRDVPAHALSGLTLLNRYGSRQSGSASGGGHGQAAAWSRGPGRQRPLKNARYEIRDTGSMVEDIARDRAIYQALKAIDEVAAALQTHLIEEHEADPERAAAQGSSTNSLKLLRQARERLGQGLRAIEADNIAETDHISLRNQ